MRRINIGGFVYNKDLFIETIKKTPLIVGFNEDISEDISNAIRKYIYKKIKDMFNYQG